MRHLKDSTEYVRSRFGRDCAAVLTDREDDGTVVLYVNRSLGGYREHNGIYVREVDAEKLGELNVRSLGTDARFMPFFGTTWRNGDLVELRDLNREEDIATSLIELKGVEPGYAKVPSRKFCFSLGGYIPAADFPEDSTLVHECTHGVVAIKFPYKLGQKLDERRYIVEESLASFVELSYMLERYPEDARRWVSSRKDMETDRVHAEAWELILGRNLDFEELMRMLREL